MPNDEAARARAEQKVNNAHQGDNDARQNRNDTAQAAAKKELAQTQTNLEQGDTNAAQGITNADQLDTNTAQGVTNAEQGDTNSAQEVTNTEQLDVNAAIRETIKLLANSVDANTVSMEAVSGALKENLELYARIDVRLTEAEHKTNKTERHAIAIEAKSDSRAGTFRRMWAMLVVMLLVIGLGGFGLNAYRTKQLCMQRNEANSSNTLLVQEDVNMLLAKDPTNPALPGLQRYLTRSVQVNCGGFL